MHRPDKRNVIHFLSNEALNGLYYGRVKKYLQPESVALNCVADTEHAFTEMTGNPANPWHLLIIDAARARSATEAIRRFRAAHPTCVVGLLKRKDEIPPPLENVTLCTSPADLDDWLLMMNTLLGGT